MAIERVEIHLREDYEIYNSLQRVATNNTIKQWCINNGWFNFDETLRDMDVSTTHYEAYISYDGGMNSFTIHDPLYKHFKISV